MVSLCCCVSRSLNCSGLHYSSSSRAAGVRAVTAISAAVAVYSFSSNSKYSGNSSVLLYMEFYIFEGTSQHYEVSSILFNKETTTIQ
jgi:hypothetical protein